MCVCVYSNQSRRQSTVHCVMILNPHTIQELMANAGSLDVKVGGANLYQFPQFQQVHLSMTFQPLDFENEEETEQSGWLGTMLDKYKPHYPSRLGLKETLTICVQKSVKSVSPWVCDAEDPRVGDLVSRSRLHKTDSVADLKGTGRCWLPDFIAQKHEIAKARPWTMTPQICYIICDIEPGTRT